jgi:hypothetical protein
MKTIIETTSSLSKYLLNDDVVVTLSADHIVVGEPPQFIVADLNADNAVVYEGVTAPDDWTGNKYTFDGSVWTLSPNWVEMPA